MNAPNKLPLQTSNNANTSHHQNLLTANNANNIHQQNLQKVADKSANKENVGLQRNASTKSSDAKKPVLDKAKAQQSKVALKTTSLQLCIKLNEESQISPRPWEPVSSSSDMWEFSDSESAPASSWSILPNRSLLYRPLPLDVGRCSCIIVKERAEGNTGMLFYSLYTDEGKGRQDRKLAMARHRRRHGRSEFIVAQNPKGIFCASDDSFLGTITANLMGSKYQIWDQGITADTSKNHSRRLLGVVEHKPTITTITGRVRSMRAWIPKQKSMQLKNSSSAKIQHLNGLPKEWEQKRNKAEQLVSRIPFYNSFTRRYELDFRERTGRTGQRIQTSARNFQLTMEEKGRQTILQLGKIGTSTYIMNYRYPLTGYQAFCICLTSIDSKLCCSL